MNPKVHNVYFIGIGGIGMSALARYYLLQGTKVYGYDATKTELTEELSDLGAQISYEDICQDFFQILDLVVYTPAIPETSVIFNYFKSSKIPMFKRAQVLGAISKQKNTIAVAGSHGKTTISTMISYLFYHAQIPVNAFLGGISANFNSNYLVGDSQICVVEADEYDRSFLQLSPKCIVISSIDSDHLDIYGTKEHIIQAFQDFVNLLPEDGTLIIHHDIAHLIETKARKITYGLSNGDFHSISYNTAAFDNSFVTNTSEAYKMAYNGIHNIENALAAIQVAKLFGLSHNQIAQGLAEFKGVKRRFELVAKYGQYTYIDDYAHHPTELKALIESLRAIYPHQKIAGVFQPHLYSRTRDFSEAFAASLSMLDYAYVMDVYPARELPIPGVTSKLIVDKIVQPKALVSEIDLFDLLKNTDFHILISIGAGNIIDLKEKFIKIIYDKHLNS